MSRIIWIGERSIGGIRRLWRGHLFQARRKLGLVALLITLFGSGIAQGGSVILNESQEYAAIQKLVNSDIGKVAVLRLFSNIDEAAKCGGLTAAVLVAELHNQLTLNSEDRMFYSLMYLGSLTYRDQKGISKDEFGAKVKYYADIAATGAMASIRTECQDMFIAFSKTLE